MPVAVPCCQYFPEKPKILISGAFGLIGSAVTSHLMGRYAIIQHDPPKNYYANIDQPYSVFIDCGRYDPPSAQTLLWKFVIHEMKKQNRGRIILFSSIYGHKAPDFSIYDGTEINETPLEYAMIKGGIEQATRYLAEKLKPWNIQVNAIAPGGVRDQHSEAFRAAYGVHAPMIACRNILPVIDMLLHADNAVNGQVITVDNGWTL